MTAEKAIRFGRGLFGIISEPDDRFACSGTAVLLLNAGLLHHVGPGCLYVALARQLAGQGHVVLRFDFSGVGDSEARDDGMDFDSSAVLEAVQAMDMLAESRGVKRFIAGGICSGAVMSLRLALADPRVTAVALLNPQGHFSPESRRIGAFMQAEKNKRHLLRVSIRRRESWARLLRGKVDVPGIAKALAGRALRPIAAGSADHDRIRALARQFEVLTARGVSVLHIYAEHDPGLIELDLILRALPAARRALLQPRMVHASDHLFTPIHARERLAELLRDWIAAVDGGVRDRCGTLGRAPARMRDRDTVADAALGLVERLAGARARLFRG